MNRDSSRFTITSVTDVTNVARSRKATTMSDLLCDGRYSDLATINVKIFSEWKCRGTAAFSVSSVAAGQPSAVITSPAQHLIPALGSSWRFPRDPLVFLETI